MKLLFPPSVKNEGLFSVQMMDLAIHYFGGGGLPAMRDFRLPLRFK
jgi:hypothetical protein